MVSLLKKYKILIAVGTIILIGVVSFLVLRSKQKPGEVAVPVVEEKVEEISVQDLGLTLEARADKKAVKFEITNIRDIASIDYELSYLAKGDIPRGVIGHLDVKAGDKKIVSNFLDLGTCSRSVCKYDEGVTSVSLLVKINKTDGKVLQAQKELPL